MLLRCLPLLALLQPLFPLVLPFAPESKPIRYPPSDFYISSAEENKT